MKSYRYSKIKYLNYLLAVLSKHICRHGVGKKPALVVARVGEVIVVSIRRPLTCTLGR